MNRFRKGDHVRHPVHGRGTVVGVGIGGHEVLVSFAAAQVWVPVRHLRSEGTGLRLLGEAPPDPAPRRTPTLDAILRLLGHEPPRRDAGLPGRTKPPAPRPEARRPPRSSRPAPAWKPVREQAEASLAAAIEAFRLGIVPTAQVEQWTVGRQAEIAALDRFLANEAEGALLVEGQYGAGKSHLLTWMAHQAQEEGFVVTLAGFDPSEASAAFPKKVWRQLASRVHARRNGVSMDLRTLVEEMARASGREALLGDHWVLGPFLSRVAAGKARPEDWDWIEGREAGNGPGPTLHGYSTCANLYVNLLTALAMGFAELLHFRGLLVLLDEAEVARNVLYHYQAVRGVNFFRGLVLAANDDPDLLEEERDRQGLTVGRRTRLIYSGHNPVPYTAGIPARLKVVFALTPGSLQEEFQRARETIPRIPLDVLSMAELEELFHRILETYRQVYGAALPRPVAQRIFRVLATTDRIATVRTFLKAVVEMLDFLRFYPQEDVEAMVTEAMG